MISTLIVVVGVVSIVAVAALSGRLGLAAPLLLVLVGGGLGFVPGVPAVHVEPELILAGVLPPLLYSAAVNMPATDFRRNFGVISGLAVVLVVVTTLGVGWVLHALVPGLGWPAALAIGAVVSPTDAVAATSVGRRLGLPSRLLTILEGEGLVNDASALVLLRSAVAAMAGAASVWGTIGRFGYAVLVATALGLLLGVVAVRVRAMLGDAVLSTAVSFVVPFVAYWPAEELGASGVLAVVVTGIVIGHLGPRRLSARDRLTETTNWRTISFLLEGAIFLLMGLSLAPLVDEVDRGADGLGRSLLLGLALTALVVVFRIAFIPPLMALVRRDERRAAGTQPRLDQLQSALDGGRWADRPARDLARFQRRITRVGADAQFKLSQGLGWRGAVVLAWSGMRGAITVAAAQTLPADTPHRAQLLLIAYVVAAATLLTQGLTLPAVIRAARVPRDDPAELREEYERLIGELSASGAAALGRVEADPVLLDRVRADAGIRDRPSESHPTGPGREQYRELMLLVLDAQRRTLLDDRSDGTYRSATLDRALRHLDGQELTLRPRS
ncbi:cation:proton antiporter [Longispora urticae]